MKKYLEILLQCPLFSEIAPENLTVMLTCLGARIEHFDKKYTILAEGNPAKYIGIVLTGSAQMIRVDYYGNRSLLAEIEPTQLFGEAFACAEVSSVPVTIVATEPCDVMLVECDHVLHTCTNHCTFHQQLIFNLMKALAAQNLQFHQKLEITSKRTTREKLMTYLDRQAQKHKSAEFEIPFDRQELADYLEVDRSGLSAEISKLRREGILDCEKNRFILL
ncbi:MAG: Crp/Fnr family transcriptional regulator [Clostridia bacterium]|nr:Crp/Fnr family transcriptional regulator [Clostridia bacterium]